MPSQSELDSTYMGTALLHAGLSKAKRAKVGAVLVTNTGVIVPGYNGTPVGMDNDCEIEELDNRGAVKRLTTKQEVIHAETNSVLKAAKEGIVCLGSTVYVTLSPCVPCAAMLINAGIKELVYLEEYRNDEGLKLLNKSKVKVRKYKDEN